MPDKKYPLLILGLLICTISFFVWSAFQASTKGTQITDRNYYSKGLRYNSTQLERKAASVRGWQLATELENGALQFRLYDGSGAAISGASGLLNIYSRPDSDLLKLPLEEIDTGLYRVQLPSRLHGEMTVRVEFERTGARINRQLLINL